MKTEEQLREKLKKIREGWKYNMGLMNFYNKGQIELLEWILNDEN